MEVRIDRDACIACGLCSAIAPEIFGEDDEGLAIVLEQPQEMTPELEEAVDSCPTDAISVEE